MVFERPKRPGQPQPNSATSRPNPATQKANSGKTKKVISTGGGDSGGNRRGGNGGNGGGNGGNRDDDRPMPSPWIEHPLDPVPNPDETASFVEYLRWMRSPETQDDRKKTQDANTKVQILQMAEETANYRDRLTELTNRTKLIAGEGNTFPVKCLWRIRVGGHRGPESILLPAFDALGMPYIPSSTLRGVARTQAIRETMAERNLTWKQAEEQVSRQYFGFLDSPNGAERSGKAIFLDAYPIPQRSRESGGLAVDMANNIWPWDDAEQNWNYSPNPNPFFSLQATTFLIGVRSTSNGDEETLEQVKQWLSRGLQAGIGSQVNTGYGSLIRAGQPAATDEFFSVEFTLEGQLIHGRQKFTQWNWNERSNDWQMRGRPEAEVRPVAFKSLLRYWFRAFALGVIRPDIVRELEASIFGNINPQKRGWITVRTAHTNNSKDDLEQSGKLILAYSTEIPDTLKQVIAELIRNLTWLMFHLGGVGQGARRSLYYRSTSPKIRGSRLIPESSDVFWELPETVQEFKTLFQSRIQAFYQRLETLPDVPTINLKDLQNFNHATSHTWTEAIDRNCRILVVAGDAETSKPYALSLLHEQFHQLESENKFREAKSLCGGAKKDKILVNGQQIERKAIPSPVWIADLEDHQVVTVFGATQDPRKRYVNELRQRTDRQNYAQIFPFT
jgi:CRISPR-associated protein Cmr6